MDVSILGTGNVGRAIAVSLFDSGHQVVLGSRDAKWVGDVAKEIGTSGKDMSGTSNATALDASDQIILAVPYDAVAGSLGESNVDNKILTDLTSPLTTDFTSLTIGCRGNPKSEHRAIVAKAFNMVFAQIYSTEAVFGQPKVLNVYCGG